MKASAWSTGSGSYVPPFARIRCLEELLERGAADVLHDDVAGVVVGDEVVDLDDERVLDLREEALLGDGGGQRVGVAGVEQALEHDPAVGDVLVAREVDPAEAAVGEAARDLVLPGDQVTGVQLGREGERLAAGGAEALGAARAAVLAAADGVAALGAGALVLGHLRVLHDRPWRRPRAGRAGSWSGRRRGGPSAVAATRTGRGGWRRVPAARCEPMAADSRRNEPEVAASPAGVSTTGRRAGGRAADVAVPVDDRARAAGLLALRAVGDWRAAAACHETRRRRRGRSVGGRHPADVAVPVDDGPGASRLLALHEEPFAALVREDAYASHAS